MTVQEALLQLITACQEQNINLKAIKTDRPLRSVYADFNCLTRLSNPPRPSTVPRREQIEIYGVRLAVGQ